MGGHPDLVGTPTILYNRPGMETHPTNLSFTLSESKSLRCFPRYGRGQHDKIAGGDKPHHPPLSLEARVRLKQQRQLRLFCFHGREKADDLGQIVAFYFFLGGHIFYQPEFYKIPPRAY